MIKIEEKTFLLNGRKFRNAHIGSKLKKYTKTKRQAHANITLNNLVKCLLFTIIIVTHFMHYDKKWPNIL